jgi:hypothetical protein
LARRRLRARDRSLRPDRARAPRAVAHCFEIQGRLEEGSAWLAEREGDWAPDNAFAVHNYWHLALFQLESGDVQRTLALYDERVRGGGSEVNLELVDASALLWRLMLAGADVRARFAALADVWRRIDEHGYYGFNDWHALMAYAGAGQSAEVERVLRGLMAARSPGRATRRWSRPAEASPRSPRTTIAVRSTSCSRCARSQRASAAVTRSGTCSS